MGEDNNNSENNAENATSKFPLLLHQILIKFPSNDSVVLELQTANVSVPQMELAGRFLIRQADEFYKLQRQVDMQRQQIQIPQVVPPNLRG